MACSNVSLAAMRLTFGCCGVLALWLSVNGQPAEPKTQSPLTPLQDSSGLWGFTGDKKIEAQFEDVRPFSEVGLAAVKRKGEWLYIDKTGVPQFNKTFAEAYSFRQGVAQVRAEEGGPWTYIDAVGNPVFERYRFVDSRPFDYGFIAGLESKGGVWRWYAKNEKTAVRDIEVVFKGDRKRVAEEEFEVGVFSENRLAVKHRKTKTWRFACADEKQTINGEFAEARAFSAGLAAVKEPSEGGKWGYINAKGDWAIKASYDDARTFGSSKKAWVKSGQVWTLIGTDGVPDSSEAVEIKFSSKPDGAKVYLVELIECERDSTLLQDDKRLDEEFLLPEGSTTVEKARVAQATFWVVMRKDKLRGKVFLDAKPGGTASVSLDLK